ncbi:Acyl-CoA thioesterase I [Olavius algarvensis associated proteobacterium Delta 3]|nr:Acyl-CoA thioesterase I [Olavius algarvensis associated proteobacterium Delta 3]CAB5126586.1 Acyl-CoA thioesterase I [Olavius algarvensis associated proteobacterium Delta 3]
MKKYFIGFAIAVIGLLVFKFYFIPAHTKQFKPIGETIVCFGDSLTYGTGATPGMDYPTQLAGMIGLPVINAGVPGDTTTSALARVDRVLAQKPRIVLLTLGGNDLKNRVSKQTAFDNLKTIIETFQATGALVVIGGIDIPFYGRGFGKAYRELAKQTGAILVPNVFEDVMGHRDLMSDPIHPNGKGYKIMARHFHEAIKPYL